MDVRSLLSPGLARLSTDTSGKVTAVTILQSTGQRQFDADAADILRRWRVTPGPAREIEVSLTLSDEWQTSVRPCPTCGGRMTSG